MATHISREENPEAFIVPRNAKGHFLKGESGNPAGRVKGRVEFQQKCRDRTEKALKIIDDACKSPDLQHQRWAAMTILAYAWGKPDAIRADDEVVEQGRPKTDVIELSKRIIFILGSASARAKPKLLDAEVTKP